MFSTFGHYRLIAFSHGSQKRVEWNEAGSVERGGCNRGGALISNAIGVGQLDVPGQLREHADVGWRRRRRRRRRDTRSADSVVFCYARAVALVWGTLKAHEWPGNKYCQRNSPLWHAKRAAAAATTIPTLSQP